MDFCFRCNQSVNCECLALLYPDDANTYLEEGNDHKIGLLKPFEISDVQRISSKSLFSQLKVLNQYSEQIKKKSNLIIQETTKLSEISLQKVQEKRIELLNDLKLTNKRITDEEIRILQVVSNEVLVSQVPCLVQVQEQIQKYFKNAFYKKQSKLHFSDSSQAKKYLIEHYGLFLEGHTDSINGVALTSDKKFIVSSSQDKTVRIWNLQEKRQVAVLKGHTSAVYNVAITNDNKFIISRSIDQTVRVWNLQEKCQVAVLEGNRLTIFSLAIASDNKFIVYGSKNNTVQVWNLQEKCQEAVLRGHTSYVWSVKITSDNKFIVSSSYDKTVRVWNLQEKCQETVLEGHTSGVK